MLDEIKDFDMAHTKQSQLNLKPTNLARINSEVTDGNACDRLKSDILLLQSQQRRMKNLSTMLKKLLKQMLASPKRSQRDHRGIKRLHFCWFGGVQFSYRQEGES
jgi:hypothetical protein